MRAAISSMVLVTGVALCSGCDRSSQPAASPPPTKATPPAATPLSEIFIEVRSDDGSTSLNQDAGEGASTRAGKNLVEIKDGRAIANGQDGGKRENGDRSSSITPAS